MIVLSSKKLAQVAEPALEELPFEEAFQEPVPEPTQKKIAPKPKITPKPDVIPEASPEEVSPATQTQTPPIPPAGVEPVLPKPIAPFVPSPEWEPKPVEKPEKISPPGPDRPEDPAAIFEEVIPPQTPLEQQNQIMDVRQKVFQSMSEGTPLAIKYTTLAGTPISRKVIGLYVYYGDTKRHVLVAHDLDVNDFRAFVVDGITDATLLEGTPGAAAPQAA